MNAQPLRILVPQSAQLVTSPPVDLIGSLSPRERAGVRGKRTPANPKPKKFSYGIRLYETRWTDKKRRRTYTSHVVTYRENGKRIKEKRASRAAALALAETVETRIGNGQIGMLKLGQEDFGCYLRCKQIAAPTGKPLEILTADQVECLAILGGRITPAEACRYWLQHHQVDAVRNIPDLVTDLLDRKKLCLKHRRNLEHILEKFAAKFTGPFQSLRARDIEDWLDSITLSPRERAGVRGKAAPANPPRAGHPLPQGEGRGEGEGDVSKPIATHPRNTKPIALRTRHNYRAAIAGLVAFAKQRNCLPKDWDTLDQVPDPDSGPGAVNLYTPDELVRLLNKAETYKAGRKLVPLIAITAFAGVRHGEMNEEKIEHLDWSCFDWETRKIYIDGKTAKQTGRAGGDDRAVDMPENLVAWLEPYRRPSGKVVPLVNTSSALCRLRKKAGIQGPKKNALRKSFITYKLALGNFIEAVADQAGNSPTVIRRNYKAARHTKYAADAARWFGITPLRADVLPLFNWQKATGQAATR